MLQDMRDCLDRKERDALCLGGPCWARFSLNLNSTGHLQFEQSPFLYGYVAEAHIIFAIGASVIKCMCSEGLPFENIQRSSYIHKVGCIDETFVKNKIMNVQYKWWISAKEKFPAPTYLPS